MGKKASTYNDRLIDYIYNSTFWPELLPDGIAPFIDEDLTELIRGARSKREARNIIVKALRDLEKRGDGLNFLKAAQSDYADAYGQAGEPDVFNLEAEALHDLDPYTMGVDEVAEQVAALAGSLGYDAGNGGVDQFLKDFYGQKLGTYVPTSRDYADSFGKLNDRLDAGADEASAWRQQLGLTPDADDEYIRNYAAALADRANRIRLAKERSGFVNGVENVLAPYSNEAYNLGQNPTLGDRSMDVLSWLVTGAGRNGAKIASAGSGTERAAKTTLGKAGLASTLNAFPDFLNGVADSLGTEHTYTLDENGAPGYTEGAKVDFLGGLGKAAKDVSTGLGMMLFTGRGLGNRLAKTFDDLPVVGGAKKKAENVWNALFNGKKQKAVAREKQLQANAEGQVEKAWKDYKSVEAKYAGNKTDRMGRPNPEYRKEIEAVEKKAERKQKLADKHLKKAEELEQTESKLGAAAKVARELAVIRMLQTNLIPFGWRGLMSIFDRQ